MFHIDAIINFENWGDMKWILAHGPSFKIMKKWIQYSGTFFHSSFWAHAGILLNQLPLMEYSMHTLHNAVCHCCILMPPLTPNTTLRLCIRYFAHHFMLHVFLFTYLVLYFTEKILFVVALSHQINITILWYRLWLLLYWVNDKLLRAGQHSES